MISKVCKVLAKFLVLLAICSRLMLPQPQTASGNKARLHSEPVETRVDGAGSTTIYPLLSAWISKYNSLHPGIRIFYRAIGSKGGSSALTKKTTFFAATDVPMSDDELASASGRILHIPIALNAIVPAYNLANVHELHFGGNTLAGIFLGKITKWNDAAISADNPGVVLPGMDIKVIHYFPNGSRETDVMADYLSKVSPGVKEMLTHSSGEWPLRSIIYKGAEGAEAFVRHTPGAVGYVWKSPYRGTEQYGMVKNVNGEFVAASPESLTAASASAVPTIEAQGQDFRVSITNAPGKKSYPIASYTWLLLYEDSKDKKKNEVMNDFLKWVLTDGQRLALKLGYPPLPNNLVEMELQRLRLSGK